MWRLFILFLLFLGFIPMVTFAAGISCTVSSGNIMTLTLPSSFSAGDRATSGLAVESNNTYRELYTWNYARLPGKSVSCSPATATVAVYQYVISSYGEGTKYKGYWIFPTSIKGIGISFNEVGYSGGSAVGSVNNPLYFYNVILGNTGSTIQNSIKLWRTPGELGAITGDFSFYDFQIVHAYKLVSGADYFSSLPSFQTDYPMPRSVTVAAVTYSGSIKFISGTCNFTNKTVEMGKYSRSDIANNTPWVDASFTLNCPEAWGYGTTANMSGTTANTITSRNPTNTATKGIIVTVSPRNGTVNGTRGIIGLKPGGAEGLGIQLAWGDSTSLPTTGDPAKPVLFDQSQVVSDENFGTSGNTYTREIKMAARYIRTTGTLQPGRADSAIEIVASYN